jgi:hypothetical protein
MAPGRNHRRVKIVHQLLSPWLTGLFGLLKNLEPNENHLISIKYPKALLHLLLDLKIIKEEEL